MGKRKSTKDCLMFQHKIFFALFFTPIISFAQLKWQNVDSLYQPLPKTIHVFYTDSKIDTATFRAFYVIADLKDKKLNFTTDTTYKRRLTPAQFYEKNRQPLVVVNGTFFSFETNQNLNLAIKKGKLVSYNRQTIIGRGKDTFTYRHVFASAIGISKKRTADIAWTLTDSSKKYSFASQRQFEPYKDSNAIENFDAAVYRTSIVSHGGGQPTFVKWKMKTAIGGGPVLLQNGEIKITNNEELKFPGKAINDKHPRTAMGYTKDNKLIILVVQGRSESASGASLIQEAQILKDLGCVEALNLDGGGSSCLLVNGKETIKPSDKTQRAVPAVFIIKSK
jgi:exopolysaccharide biosynthesis protein